MARIYKTSDRIKYKIGELEFSISPLDVHDKALLQSYLIEGQSKKESDLAQAVLKASYSAVKMAVKDVKGLENPDGSPYVLEFEENGKHLTDSCVDDLFNIEENTLIANTALAFISKIPDSSQIPQGVSLVKDDQQSPNEHKS